jgi:large subunit ribosomal protein L31
MKQGIHPKDWQHDCVVTCSCGNTFVTGGVKKTMQIDICNACHPFFTGEMRFVDRQGRVDKFQKKMQIAQAAASAAASKAKKTVKAKAESKSYKQILTEQQAELKAKKQAAAPAEN